MAWIRLAELAKMTKGVAAYTTLQKQARAGIITAKRGGTRNGWLVDDNDPKVQELIQRGAPIHTDTDADIIKLLHLVIQEQRRIITDQHELIKRLESDKPKQNKHTASKPKQHSRINEQRLAELLDTDMSTKDIANELHISQSTVFRRRKARAAESKS